MINFAYTCIRISIVMFVGFLNLIAYIRNLALFDAFVPLNMKLLVLVHGHQAETSAMGRELDHPV